MKTICMPAAILSVLVLAACTGEEAINAQYAGQPLTTVFTDLGPPDNAVALDSGQTEYVWNDAASDSGVSSCARRIISDGSGTVVRATHTDGTNRC